MSKAPTSALPPAGSGAQQPSGAVQEPRELRVLQGAQRGAVLALQAQRTYSVGTALDADIVVRLEAGSTDLSDSRAEISLAVDGLVLKALAGDVQVDGQALAAGQSRKLPWTTPWQLGGVSLAAGPTGPWQAAGQTTAPAQAEARPAGTAKSVVPTPEQARGWGRRLITGGATVVIASLSMWALAMAIAPSSPRPDALAQRAQASLHAAGMTAVTVSSQPGQSELLVEGYLDTRAQRTRAENLLAEQGLRPRFDVWINENLAQAVQDVYRVHGVSAEVQPLGPGRVRVNTALADPTALSTVEKAVRRDVQGLNHLEARNLPPAAMPSPIPTLDDPGKRVASLVAGDTPYVVTQDGTRYFIGALLPTGHRILAIEDGRVELEREGFNSALVF